MNPHDSETPQQAAPAAGAPLPPIQRPSKSLADLDAAFCKDMDSAALPAAARLNAGRLHQVVLHLQRMDRNMRKLFEGRKEDMAAVEQQFEEVTKVLTPLVRAAAAQAGAQGQAAQHGAEGQQEEQPPPQGAQQGAP